MKKGLLVILAGATALYFIAKKSLSSKLLFQIDNLGSKGKWYNPIIVISLRVLNPSNQSAKLNSITGELFLNGKLISNVTSFVPQNISAKAESIIKLEAQPGITGAASLLLDILQNKKAGYKIKFDGNANVDGIVVPINQSFAI